MPTVFDLSKIYKEYFGKQPYFVTPKGSSEPTTSDINYTGIPTNSTPRGFIHYSKTNQPFNKIGLYGQDIWFPIKLNGFQVENNKISKNIELEIDAVTVSVNSMKTIIRTPVSERKGTVKEIFNIDDYKFTIRGFLIGKNRKVPEQEILDLKLLFESSEEVKLFGGYPELFLDTTCRVVISSLEFPEVQGKAHWIHPFVMQCESDYITDLETIPN